MGNLDHAFLYSCRSGSNVLQMPDSEKLSLGKATEKCAAIGRMKGMKA